jgi:hypothetical protein
VEGICGNIPLKPELVNNLSRKFLGYKIIPSHPLKYHRSKQVVRPRLTEVVCSGLLGGDLVKTRVSPIHLPTICRWIWRRQVTLSYRVVPRASITTCECVTCQAADSSFLFQRDEACIIYEDGAIDWARKKREEGDVAQLRLYPRCFLGDFWGLIQQNRPAKWWKWDL